MKSQKRAFTLIELLVVIAIIAILAAILFPVFAKAREKAKQSKSLNNVRQLSIGVSSYSNDYNETFPGWMQPTGGTVYAHNCWDEQIDPSIKSKDVYNNGDTGIRSSAQPAPKSRVLTYGLNGLLIAPAATFTGNGDWATNATSPGPLSLSGVNNPAGTILFAELATTAGPGAISGTYGTVNPVAYTGGQGTGTGSTQWTGGFAGWIDIDPANWVAQGKAAAAYSDTGTTPWAGTNNQGVARDLYGGGGSFAFTDSHVKFYRLTETVGMGKTGTDNVVNTAANAFRPANNWNMWNPG